MGNVGDVVLLMGPGLVALVLVGDRVLMVVEGVVAGEVLLGIVAGEVLNVPPSWPGSFALGRTSVYSPSYLCVY